MRERIWARAAREFRKTRSIPFTKNVVPEGDSSCSVFPQTKSLLLLVSQLLLKENPLAPNIFTSTSFPCKTTAVGNVFTAKGIKMRGWRVPECGGRVS
jgi:hypothetical protein